MRELKFRIWDKSRNCFATQKIINIGGGISTNFGDYHIDLDGDLRYMNYDSADLDDNAVIQQYTGCKDKNGKEIYEGDIIKHTNLGMTHNGTIRFYAGAFFVDWEDESDDMLGYLLTTGIEVVGNIFEYKK